MTELVLLVAVVVIAVLGPQPKRPAEPEDGPPPTPEECWNIHCENPEAQA